MGCVQGTPQEKIPTPSPSQTTPEQNRIFFDPKIPADPNRPRFMNGDTIVAIFDYEGQSEGELSFTKYTKFIINDAEDQDWLFVSSEVTGNHGYVPVNYVSPLNSLEIYDWYFGAITRLEAEALLIDSPEGTFLIRDCSTNQNDLALSVKCKSSNQAKPVRHYIISYDNGLYSIWKRKFFDNLSELVREYKVNSHGLPCNLLFPLHKHASAMNDLSRGTKTDWEIDRHDIHFLREIGSGNFGVVYHGRWKNKTEVAVKELKKGCMTTAEFLQEATIMKELKHPNIVSLFATCSKSEPIYIITPFMEKGSLYELLRGHQKTPFAVDQLMEFAFQISKGMFYLELKSLVHSDLAARNVLVDKSYTCKIADFGLAKKLVGKDLSVSTGKIPIKWSAPEVFTRGEFSIKSDVWSFGIVIVEIFTHGQMLYKGMTKEEIRHEVSNGYRLPKPSLCPPEMYEVLLKCWDKYPLERPSFKLLKNHLNDACHRVVNGRVYQIWSENP